MSLLAIALTVGFTTLVPGHAVNANTNPIVVTSDPAAVTHTLTLSAGGLTAAFGTDANGGGYWNSLILTGYGALDGRNLVQTDFGKGGQLAEFDRAHNVNYYNPTQAGDSDPAGTPITMTQVTHKLCTGQFDVALWHQQPGNNTFSNLRSEQDLQACYIDRSAMFGVPAVQVDFLIGYVSQPDAIHQFDSVYDQQWATVAIDGIQTGKANDLSRQKLIWSFRLASADFPYVMWESSAVWQSHTLDNTNFECQTGTNGAYNFVRGTSLVETLTGGTCGGVDNDFQCLTTGTNPAVNAAVCLYWPMTGPDSVNNVMQTHVVTPTAITGVSADHPANWHSQSFFRSAIDDPPTNALAALKFVHSMSGALAPDGWQGTSGRGFLLFCTTAAQCATAVAAWRAANFTGNEAP